MTFGNPDFVAYARAHGVKGSRLEDADDLAPMLEAAFAAGEFISWWRLWTMPKTAGTSSRSFAPRAANHGEQQ
jgi:hypothetical protein